MNTDPTPSPTAVHEAGHAVVASMMGRPYGVALYPDGSGLATSGSLDRAPAMADYALATVESCYSKDTLPELITDMTITAAGAVAVSMAAYDPLVTVRGGDRVLLSAAARAAFAECDFEIERALSALACARARALLSSRWQAVEQVAQELELRRRLSADEVAEILTRHA